MSIYDRIKNFLFVDREAIDRLEAERKLLTATKPPQEGLSRLKEVERELANKAGYRVAQTARVIKEVEGSQQSTDAEFASLASVSENTTPVSYEVFYAHLKGIILYNVYTGLNEEYVSAKYREYLTRGAFVISGAFHNTGETCYYGERLQPLDAHSYEQLIKKHRTEVTSA